MREAKTYTIGLSMLRMLVGFIILKNIIFYLPAGNLFFGMNGIAPWDDFVSFCSAANLDFILPVFADPTLVTLYLVIMGASAFCFCLGLYGLPNGLILYALYFILKTRNGMILDGSDNVISVLLPYLIFADSYRHFNVSSAYDAWESRIRDKPYVKSLSHVLVVAIMIQVAFVYFFTALAKSDGPLWQNGTAVYYTMRVSEFVATRWNIPLTENMYFVVIATYSTMLIEIAFPFLIWFRSTKFYVIGAAILLHIGIFIFMRIDNFSWVMISSYAVFVTDSEYRLFYERISSAFVNNSRLQPWLRYISK